MQIKLSHVLKRLFKGRTLASLEKELAISSTLLCEWRQGRLPSGKNIIHLKRLADKYGLTLEELIFDIEPEGKRVLSTTSFLDEETKTEYKVTVEKIKSKRRG